MEGGYKLDNTIWVMSSAFPGRTLQEVIERTREIGAQGIEVCVFRQGGTRNDHIATHLEYEDFGPEQAQGVIDLFNGNGLRLSVGAYDNLICGDAETRVPNQDHILRLIANLLNNKTFLAALYCY